MSERIYDGMAIDWQHNVEGFRAAFIGVAGELGQAPLVDRLLAQGNYGDSPWPHPAALRLLESEHPGALEAVMQRHETAGEFIRQADRDRVEHAPLFSLRAFRRHRQLLRELRADGQTSWHPAGLFGSVDDYDI